MSSCRRHTAPKSLKRGIILSAPIDGGRVVERELIQCCHCQFTVVWVPGLEKGWCYCWRCSNWHCPRRACLACRPHRQWLHRASAGLDPDRLPAVGRVEAEPPK